MACGPMVRAMARSEHAGKGHGQNAGGGGHMVRDMVPDGQVARDPVYIDNGALAVRLTRGQTRGLAVGHEDHL